ncbi:hypothetical protein B5807_12033 [Epicoccum nigrum]|uniref:Uncharacterized protein n=1 Tax=Epicoccum nigrum TaxID=105696 RepID=A0A1Y2LH91_EPING|nr:hypothetical protein B5807_12033 [Epicoccum nigrum]
MVKFPKSKGLARQLRTTFNSIDEVYRQSYHHARTHAQYLVCRKIRRLKHTQYSPLRKYGVQSPSSLNATISIALTSPTLFLGLQHRSILRTPQQLAPATASQQIGCAQSPYPGILSPSEAPRARRRTEALQQSEFSSRAAC